jgi:hypothetical protein
VDVLRQHTVFKNKTIEEDWIGFACSLVTTILLLNTGRYF